MGDMGDFYRDWDAVKKAKRASNTKSSTQMLIDNGIDFESKNHGSHLVVNTPKGLIDFWPSTGKFIPRGFGRSGRGVRKVISIAKTQV